MIRKIHIMKNVTVSYEKNGILYVGVEKKVPLSQLDSKDQIPKILPDGRRTDVIIIPKARMLNYCNQENNGCGSHATKHRPLVGGLSYAPSDSGAATLGAFVRDPIDDTIVALTCNHVIGPELGEGSMTPDSYVVDITTVDMVQPSPLDGGTSPGDSIGNGKRAVPTIFGGSSVGVNIVDAAIGSISGLNMTTPGIKDLIRGGSFPFAEKNSYYVGNEIRKSGRTTGNSVGIIFSTNVNVTAILGADAVRNRAYYEGVIMVTSPTRFLSGGDSGSVVVYKSGGIWQIIGILFAGSSDGLTGYVCHIADVVDLLNIEAWDGRIYMSPSLTGVLLANGLCYYDSGIEIGTMVTHTAERVFDDCEDCISNASTKTLFGNMI